MGAAVADSAAAPYFPRGPAGLPIHSITRRRHPAPADHPPLPDLAFRVGVTGHRELPAGAVPALSDAIARLLAHIRDSVTEIGRRHAAVYAQGGAATLVVVTPMAPGTDRLVARAGARLGYRLDVPTPYDLAAEDPDFADPATPPGRLYASARARFILDGLRADAQSYVEVGRRVVWNSDLLIAVWDGRIAAGPGGTAEVVRLAREHEVPVVHFHTSESGAVTLYAGADQVKAATLEEVLPAVTRLLDQALAPPASDLGHHRASNLLRTYFAERSPRGLRRLLVGKAYALATGLAALPARLVFPSLPRDCVRASREDWRESWSRAGVARELADQLESRLLLHFAWANHLSILYALRYRSSFFWIYLLAVLAVGAAVTGHLREVNATEVRAMSRGAGCQVDPGAPTVDCARLGEELKAEKHLASGWTGAEFILLLGILSLFFRGRRGKFHEKWVDYRSLAERIRHLVFLLPLGATSPAIRVPIPALHADPSSTWLNWLFRAVVRQAGLFDARVDEAYLRQCRSLLVEDVLRGQADYHERVSRRLGSLHHRLHYFTVLLFLAAVLVSGLHYRHVEWTRLEQLPFVLAVLLPTIGAAVHGFLSQGDFENVALRAEGAQRQLARLADEVTALVLPTPAEREEAARAVRRDELRRLGEDGLRRLAVRLVCERLDPDDEPALTLAVPDLERRLQEWRQAVERWNEAELRQLLAGRPIGNYPPAASAELGRYARHAADIMGDELIGWRADSQVRPLVLA